MPNPSITPTPISAQAHQRLSRRAFLLGVGVAATSTLLAACAPRTVRPEPLAELSSPPLRLLPSQQMPVATDAGALTNFLALSALLTGVPLLDPDVGSVYLAHLQATQAATLTALYTQAGFASATPPTTLQAMEETGIFANEPMQGLADRIIELWYTGKYKDDEGADVVVTFVDALAWKILDFTKPPTICGSPGFWAFAPAQITFDF